MAKIKDELGFKATKTIKAAEAAFIIFIMYALIGQILFTLSLPILQLLPNFNAFFWCNIHGIAFFNIKCLVELIHV